ncbi:MAG TPA: HhH-GPD-type base excision DNA repair protein [Streptosporangiaceae bacterium]|nr:HhH-GPD-type base excision DNA repair protein [Streptosporangiaceae bacterium]
MTLSLPVSDAANELLSRSPLALLIGMLLDQQVTIEKAFSGPAGLVHRLGHELDARELADYDPEALAAIFAQRPALHRFPRAMAARVQELCRLIAGQYDGDAARVWTSARSGQELLTRVGELPGFGAQKAQIFVALLGKQLGVRPRGWRQAAGPFGEKASYRSVADIVDPASLARVRAFKQELKARGARAPG